VDLDVEQFSELKKLAGEPGAWQYLQIIDVPDFVALRADGKNWVEGVRFVLYPALVK
jgi:hypothetical protein